MKKLRRKIYTGCGRITRTNEHEAIPREKIRTKYGNKFFHLRFSFPKKSSLKIYQVYINVANCRLDMSERSIECHRGNI